MTSKTFIAAFGVILAIGIAGCGNNYRRDQSNVNSGQTPPPSNIPPGSSNEFRCGTNVTTGGWTACRSVLNTERIKVTGQTARAITRICALPVAYSGQSYSVLSAGQCVDLIPNQVIYQMPELKNATHALMVAYQDYPALQSCLSTRNYASCPLTVFVQIMQ